MWHNLMHASLLPFLIYELKNRLTLSPQWREIFPKNQVSHHGLSHRCSVSLLFIMPTFSTSGWTVHSQLSLMTAHSKTVFTYHFAVYFSRCNSFGPMIDHADVSNQLVRMFFPGWCLKKWILSQFIPPSYTSCLSSISLFFSPHQSRILI